MKFLDGLIAERIWKAGNFGAEFNHQPVEMLIMRLAKHPQVVMNSPKVLDRKMSAMPV